ncbi:MULTISPECIES: BglG family transcription antiterminator [unclassified Mesobacillus]|jgi:activator of the mannose operon, transcriptional antiterminator|uniref:BglG family transcription antiterminator n=1 Tax=unclassified Mesobacillus TaxID=2675270 RepID=UPI00203A8CFB|nr:MULTISPECIES: BglG family transcription antiterminator [unclassified Mesobacillus]MCM3123888.1 BglG family transcription antiterminator [Mesobacillus sp. MER 33]MCM3234097.1 BglG family transcription antiterminator [Mesobacillus sp. MER 48]
MNSRNYEVLKALLESEQTFSVKELADIAGCSEKTIRNDFKVIDEWLNTETNLILVRKPGLGIFIEGKKEEKAIVLQRIMKTNGEEVSDTLRKQNVIKMLLLKDGPSTLQEFAEHFYVSKTIIRNDLEEVEEWLARFDLRLLKKQGHGIEVIGVEKNWRTALSQVTHMIIKAAAEERKSVVSIFAQGEIDFTKSRLRKLEGKLGFSFTDEALENLVTHILISIKRVKQGSRIELSDEDMALIEKKTEYNVIRNFAKDLEKAMAINLPREEIIYITLRILGSKIYYPSTIDVAKLGNELAKLDQDAVSFTKKLISAVSDVTGDPYYNDHHLLIGLALHMQTTFYRLKYSFPVENPLLNDIKSMYFTLFETIFYVMPAVLQGVQITVPEDEIAYITLHFQASFERLGKQTFNNRKVLLVCSMGVGMSQLMQTKLERKFHNLEIVGTSSVKDVKKEINDKNPDLIISTVPFESGPVPIITVSPFLMLEEERKIKDMLENPVLEQKETKFQTISHLMEKELIVINPDRDTRPGIIGRLSDILIEKGYIEPEYKQSVFTREEQSSTVIGCGIAIPHGNPDFVKEAKLAVALYREPIQWGSDQVSVVFLLAIDHESKGLLKELFKEISKMMDDNLTLFNLAKASTPEEVLKIIN